MDNQGKHSYLLTLCASVGAAVAGLAPHSAWAQSSKFPTGPVHIYTTYAPGSQSDRVARTLADYLKKPLGVPVVIENTPGAGGLIATQAVLRTPPLGYRMLYSTTALTGNLYGFRNPGYKLEDFKVVGVNGYTHYGLIINNAKLPVKNVSELVAYLKAHPGKFNFGSVGPSAGSTVLGERFKYVTGTDIANIPYKGGAPLATALLAGEIQIYFATLNTARIRMRNKDILGLAVTSTERRKETPDLPTLKEAGYPQMVLTSWSALFLPSAAPKTALDTLRAAYKEAERTSDLRQQWEKQAYLPWTGTLDEFFDYIKKEGEEVGDDFKRVGVKPIEN